MVRDKCDQAEIYSRKWNLRLINLKETDGENIRNRVLEILKILTLDETDDIRFSQFIELDVSERGIIALGRLSFSSRSEFTKRKFGELHGIILLLRKEVSRGSDICRKTTEEAAMAKDKSSEGRGEESLLSWSRCLYRWRKTVCRVSR